MIKLINLFIIHNLYIINYKYISNLISNYPFIHLYVVQNDIEIYDNIISKNLIYSNIIIIDNILRLSENLLMLINNLNGNFYILNYFKYSKFIYSHYLDKLNKLNNDYPNIKYIDYNLDNIFILNKTFSSINILYPLINLHNEDFEKTYDIITFDKKNIDLNFNINVVEYFNYNLNKVFFYKHKILIIFHFSENEYMEYETIIQECISKKVIIIFSFINNFQLNIKNHIFKDFIFIIPYNSLSNVINNILNDYNNFINKLFHINFNNLINHLQTENNNTINHIMNSNNYGFIIIRCVNSKISNDYWKNCYKCIRKFYDNKIYIIDDNSDKKYLNNDNIDLFNCEVIFSDFHKRGEILPYYYMHKLKLFKKAVIIHDSVFINKWIDFFKYKNVKFLWHFTHDWDNDKEILDLLQYIHNNNTLTHFFNYKNKWMGCFGVQSVIDYDFLNYLHKKYKIFNLLDLIDNRDKRMTFERIFGLICTLNNNLLSNEPSIFGIIHHYIHWGYTYENYIHDFNNNNLNHLDIVKVWSGR
jgi:hypothetical protein